jgi:toxin ParE1/3/4
MIAYNIAPLARTDLDAIWDYLGIQKDAPAAARRQIEKLYEKSSLLSGQPFLGETRDDLGPGLRSFVAGNHVVVYKIAENQGEIARVVHFARDIRSLFD